jgi:hypothetical protein
MTESRDSLDLLSWPTNALAEASIDSCVPYPVNVYGVATIGPAIPDDILDDLKPMFLV